jgi:hypothetical protein
VQEDRDGVEKVVQYVSHALSATQRRWATIEKEAYAVVYALNKLRTYIYGAAFTVYTDHKPFKSLFTKDMNNTKIQRWGVLLAEYGAMIEYRKGANNIRGDMLSRIKHEHVAVIDTGDWVEPDAFTAEDLQDVMPLLHDGLNLKTTGEEQRNEFPALWEQRDNEDNEDYEIIQGVLYSTKPPNAHASLYPRLVLPAAHEVP